MRQKPFSIHPPESVGKPEMKNNQYLPTLEGAESTIDLILLRMDLFV
jgi:hypothetical protein